MKRPIVLLILLTAFLLIVELASSGSSSANSSKPQSQPGSLSPSRPQPSPQVDPNKKVAPSDATQANDDDDQGYDPDLPDGLSGSIDKQTYLRMRDEYIGLRRGIESGRPIDPGARTRAIERMEGQEFEVSGKNSFFGSIANFLGLDLNAGSAWTPIGPAPLPGNFNFSGRVTSVVVDPTNPNIVYLGAAQGGVWRSLDGGGTWAPIFDNAQSMAIGALALAPSDHTVLYVGTGEFNGCGSCFFGAGLYRIDNADTSATLVGPINPSQTIGSLTYNIFNGRSISKILVHPTNPNTIFVATGSGVGGSGGNALGGIPPMATRGVYRSFNGTAAPGSVTFQKLVVNTDNSFDSPASGNVTISDMVMDPGNPDVLLVGVIGQTQPGGIYRSTNALAATPSFTQAQSLAIGIRVSLAINNIGGAATAYAGTSETPTNTPGCTAANSGAVRKSTDGGATWTGQLTGGGGYCSGQCFYDMPIAVDPNDANVVYVGGQTSSTCGGVVRKSTDGGSTFANDSNGLHADDHAFFFDTAGNIYTGNDGGIWKRSASAAPNTAWTNLNHAPLNTLQFESIAVHPIDANLTIGGTQDNGTELQSTTSGSWTNIRGGDGGYTLIDQNATDTTNVTMYHTFFFSGGTNGTQIRYERASTVGGAWTNIGCTGGNQANGINCTDNVLFYAPMALGPGNPNTVYLGTDRLYRSTDRGTTNTVVSQAPISGISPVSTIAISPQDDNYRLVGMRDGTVWATSTGSSTLINITSPSFPANPAGGTNRFVGRAMIDPNNKDVAYVAFSYYAASGQGVWKITNLGAASGAAPTTPNWTVAGNGIPSIPINAFAVDPLNSNNLFAGTDIGVYNSTDGGANWFPFGAGLPRSAVFDMKIQNTNRILRVATHGRGMWEISIGAASPTLRLTAPDFPIAENSSNGFVTIAVQRDGDASNAVTVKFGTSDTSSLNAPCSQVTGKASERCDYETTAGTLRFAAGETNKTFIVPIVNDVNVEGTETFNITLSAPVGATLSSLSNATVTITDNDSPGATNPIESPAFFITQQYLDFLGRLPDSGGFQNWYATLAGGTDSGGTVHPPCPNGGFGEFDNPNCDRVHVSAGFFLSDEFRVRGYWAYRFYEVGFDRRPLYTEFVPDMAQVGGAQSPQSEALSKATYTDEFVLRPEFQATFALSNQAYVDKLEQNAEVTLSNKAALVSALNAGTKTKAQVLREIVESQAVEDRFYIRAFVAMQYFGYLRRDPDTTGYNNWITALTNNPADYRHMIFGFIYSDEYRFRFGP